MVSESLHPEYVVKYGGDTTTITLTVTYPSTYRASKYLEGWQRAVRTGSLEQLIDREVWGAHDGIAGAYIYKQEIEYLINKALVLAQHWKDRRWYRFLWLGGDHASRTALLEFNKACEAIRAQFNQKDTAL